MLSLKKERTDSMESRQKTSLTEHQEFEDIVNLEKIETLFQPIVSLKNGRILGYEALSRGPEESRFYRPDRLFEHAHQMEEVWKLDLLCRKKAIEKAKDFVGENKLFINIDPLSIEDSNFQKGFTKEHLKAFHLDSSDIVMEITEKTAIEDYGIFNKLLNSYRDQGYSIAVDDAGSGFSGLRTLAETRPEYIKIDMELVRNIDKDVLKQELLKSIRTFSYTVGIKIIAEGIETPDEMRKLIELGIDYGQGYWLGRPRKKVSGIDPKVVVEICNWNASIEKIQSNEEKIRVKDLLREDEALTAEATVKEADEKFIENAHLQGIAIVQDHRPIGLVMRHKFEVKKQLAGNLEEFFKLGVDTIMDQRPLLIESDLSISEVKSLAIARREERIYDYILAVHQGYYRGIVSVASLLQVMAYT